MMNEQRLNPIKKRAFNRHLTLIEGTALMAMLMEEMITTEATILLMTRTRIIV